MVTIISRERAQPRRLATRDYRQVVCPGCEKFPVDNKMLAYAIRVKQGYNYGLRASIAAQLGL